MSLRFALLLLIFSLTGMFAESIETVVPATTSRVLGDSDSSALAYRGYRALANKDNGFLAVGTEGRIDWISAEGSVTRSQRIPNVSLTDLLVGEGFTVASGEKGFLFFSTNNGAFVQVESGTKSDLHALAFFSGKVLVGSDDGVLLVGDKTGTFQKQQLPLLGKIVSLSANDKVCYGVTDKGEIAHTKDGINWSVLDFNEFYAGYYKPCRFTQVLVTDTRIAVIGVHQDDTPALIFSTEGSVWTERGLNYADENNLSGVLDVAPNNLIYNASIDEFVLCCNKGKLLVVPACSHCNKLYKFGTEDLYGMATTENNLLVAGGNYFVKSILY